MSLLRRLRVLRLWLLCSRLLRLRRRLLHLWRWLPYRCFASRLRAFHPALLTVAPALSPIVVSRTGFAVALLRLRAHGVGLRTCSVFLLRAVPAFAIALLGLRSRCCVGLGTCRDFLLRAPVAFLGTPAGRVVLCTPRGIVFPRT